MNINKKGFTLIELLVVIAIIGILSSVVLASLNAARGKGANAAVKSNLQGIRSQAEIVYDDNNQDYSTLCTNPNVINAVVAAMTAGGDADGMLNYTTNNDIANRCNANATEWSVNVLLKVPEGGNDWWCVDTLGTAKSEAAELGGATVCA